MKSLTQKMKKQEKKQGRSFFDPKLAAVKTDQLNLFKVIRRFKNPIYYQFKKILMKTKIENNNFPKLKSTFMPHCVTDQRKWRRSLVHRGTRNKNFPLQKFWLKSQARITTTRKIFDLIETSFVISNFPNIETNTLYFLSRKWEGGNINWKSKQVLLCTIANWMTGQCTLTQLCQSTFMWAFVITQNIILFLGFETMRLIDTTGYFSMAKQQPMKKKQSIE